MTSKVSTRRLEHGLPVDVTSFVGRRHELAEARRLLSASRIVTLTGVGGVGKTRLASRIAVDVRRAFPDGVWLVELAGLENPQLLVPEVIGALEIRDLSSRSPLDVLVDYLCHRRALLILDNCEHLLQPCAAVVQEVLRAAPGVRVLTTSRQPLGIAGERLLDVPPLSLPAEGGSPRLAGASEQYEAVRLFVDRAKASVPDFALTGSNQEAVERICRRLDGLPLAIELAAARIRSLTAQQLLERLDDRFRLLNKGPRGVMPRHRTLRALIDWSHSLCSPKERALWARVSVFSGSLNLEAAEAVCAGGVIETEEIIDLIAELVDKSILLRDEYPAEMRYRLLDTICQYGRERLAEFGQRTALRRRHRDHYRRVVAEGYVQAFGPSQTDLMSRFRCEHANLRSALEFCFAEPADARAGLDMAADLIFHWSTGYHLAEGRRWLDTGLAVHTEEDGVRARALWVCSWLAILQADIPAAEAMLAESRAIGEQSELGSPQPGQDSTLAYTALYAGVVALYRSRADRAIALLERAADLHRTAGDPRGLALALIRLSLAHSHLGDSATAVAVGEECVAVCDTHGDHWAIAYARTALGIAAFRQGDRERATRLVKESMRLHRSLDDPLGVGLGLEVLAWTAAAEGRHKEAVRLLGMAEVIWRTVGAPRLSGYGHLAGYRDECESEAREALGASAFDEAHRRGAGLGYDEVLTEAFGGRRPLAEGRGGTRAQEQVLTRREREIAGLVAEGKSNREIAAELVIALRTAEGHVERILTKLGFNRRAQIAAWVAGSGRGSDDEKS
nr:LuxR C-terminal-related transcriptional regulator [Actinomadura soli]